MGALSDSGSDNDYVPDEEDIGCIELPLLRTTQYVPEPSPAKRVVPSVSAHHGDGDDDDIIEGFTHHAFLYLHASTEHRKGSGEQRVTLRGCDTIRFTQQLLLTTPTTAATSETTPCTNKEEVGRRTI